MDIYKNTLLRKLKAECSEVNDELLEVDSLFNQAVPLFCAATNKYCEINSCKNPLNDLDLQEKEELKSVNPKFKSVYRKIAVKTHPDKSCASDDTVNVYQDATDAKKNNQVDKLISIAKDLKIDIYDFSYQDIKSIEESILETKSKIKKIRESYPSVWFFSTVKKRQDIISRFVLNKV